VRSPELSPMPKTSEGSNWRRRLAVGVTALGLAPAALTVTAQSASASPSCYGDYCSGKYPDQTGCDQDVKTYVSRDLTSTDYDIGANSSDGLTATPRHVKIGTLEVRGSQVCGTEWAKLTLESPGYIEKISIVQQGTGYTQTHLAQNYLSRDGVTGVFFTPQIYTHNIPSQAVAVGDGFDDESRFTPWADGLRDN
jgi:hypothetical protein